MWPVAAGNHYKDTRRWTEALDDIQLLGKSRLRVLGPIIFELRFRVFDIPAVRWCTLSDRLVWH